MDSLRSRLAATRARHALRASGLPFDGDLERASSTTNETHLNERYVVRTNGEVNTRLSREASLYYALPNHDWSPVMVAVGGDVGANYLIVERKPGCPLAHRWPELTVPQRKRAIEQLAAYLAALHGTSMPANVARLSRSPQLLDGDASPVIAPLVAALRKLSNRADIDSGVLADVADLARGGLEHLDDHGAQRLIHGDLTFENILWHGEGLSAVVDFEWCRGAPPDLDLDVLLRCCAFPELHVSIDHADRTRTEDYADVPSWMAEAYPALFSHPHLYSRLLIYAVSFEVGQLLRYPVNGPRRSLEPQHPYNRLVALLASGGYVAETIRGAGLRV